MGAPRRFTDAESLICASENIAAWFEDLPEMAYPRPREVIVTGSTWVTLPKGHACTDAAKRGVCSVRLEVDVDFSDAIGASHVVAFLRDVRAAGIDVAWSGLHGCSVDARLLSHLAAPQSFDGSTVSLAAWGAMGFGHLYYRSGGSFVAVRDARPDFPPSRVLIEEPELCEAFMLTLQVCRRSCLAPQHRTAADTLVEERLALAIGNVLVGLPYRMTTWPNLNLK